MAVLYPPIARDKPPLRIGVMLDDLRAAAWIAEVLQGIEQSGIARVTTVILNAEPQPPASSWPQKIWRGLTGQTNFAPLLWRLYVWVDEKRHPDLLAPFRPVDLDDTLGGASILRVAPLRKGSVQRFSDADVARVKAEGLDVILRFGFNIVRGDILSAARYGVWSYHHGDNRHYRGGPAGFWEMYERNPMTGTILQILTDELDGGQVIYRSTGATGSFDSLLKARAQQYRKAIPFVLRCLRRVYAQGSAGLAIEPQGAPYARRLYRAPRNGLMLIFVTEIFLRKLFSQLGNGLGLVRDHWFLAYVPGKETQPARNQRVVVIHPPDGRFWADPCLIRSNGKNYVFFEDFDYAQKRGQISVFGIAADGSVEPARTALNTGKHLSYPFVFDWQGQHYMIPESASERSVNLYRALSFPDRWILDTELLQGIVATDATVFEQNGVWYLFTNVSETGGSTWDELFLFVASSLRGPWSPHPMNPIVSDVCGARPAGALFMRDGVLYRPAQNCARSYGESIVVQQVAEISPTRYRESPAYCIEPTWLPGIQGCHTISLGDELSIFDCKMRKWQPANFYRNARDKKGSVYGPAEEPLPGKAH